MPRAVNSWRALRAWRELVSLLAFRHLLARRSRHLLGGRAAHDRSAHYRAAGRHWRDVGAGASAAAPADIAAAVASVVATAQGGGQGNEGGAGKETAHGFHSSCLLLAWR